MATQLPPYFRYKLSLRSWKKSEGISTGGGCTKQGPENPGTCFGTYQIADLAFDRRLRSLWKRSRRCLGSMNRRSWRPVFGGMLQEDKNWGPCCEIWMLGAHWELSVMKVLLGQPLPKYNSLPRSQTFCSSPWLSRLAALKSFSQFLHSFLTHGKESKPLMSQCCLQGQCVESADAEFEPSSLSRAVS